MRDVFLTCTLIGIWKDLSMVFKKGESEVLHSRFCKVQSIWIDIPVCREKNGNECTDKVKLDWWAKYYLFTWKILGSWYNKAQYLWCMKNRVKKISPQTASCQVLDIKYIPRRSHVLKNWLPADRLSESDWSPVDYDLISKTILSGIQYNFIIGWLRKTRS